MEYADELTGYFKSGARRDFQKKSVPLRIEFFEER